MPWISQNPKLLSSSVAPEQGNSVREGIDIVSVARHFLAIHGDHVRGTDGVEVVHIHVARTSFDIEDALLAGFTVAIVGAG